MLHKGKNKISNLPKIDVARYLARIKCPPDRRPSHKFLNNLHKSHLLQIPFENLDIHMGNEIILDIHKIYHKVILRNRGGFCHELNGLFYHLLVQLGFQVRLISVKMYLEEGSLGEEFGHMAMLVGVADQIYLADVGNGKSFLQPKLLRSGLTQIDYNQYFKLNKNVDGEYLLTMSDDGITYSNRYLFSTKERRFVEFVGMCRWQQTSAESIFTQKKVITQATPDGRITLTDKLFTITKLGNSEEQPILNQDEFNVKLLQHFGIQFEMNV